MGPEFYQTRMGMKFFEGDIPHLIEAMNRLSAAIEKSNEIALMKEPKTSKED